MSRKPNHDPGRVLQRALRQFWAHGYAATSIDDLVRVTGSTRHSLYQQYGGKRGLFLACLDAYPAQAVDPAFAPVEREGAGLAEIAAFLEYQISRLAAHGLPGIGCLFANTLTELAAHDDAVAARIRAHHQRLARGFSRVLRNAAPGRAEVGRIEELAELMAVSAQGLWSASRVAQDAGSLRRMAATLMRTVEQSLGLAA